MKRIISLLLALMLAAALAAAALAEDNVLRVGMEGTYAPYAYHDDEGHLTGFEVEVAQARGGKLGCRIRLFVAAWD